MSFVLQLYGTNILQYNMTFQCLGFRVKAGQGRNIMHFMTMKLVPKSSSESLRGCVFLGLERQLAIYSIIHITTYMYVDPHPFFLVNVPGTKREGFQISQTFYVIS